MYIYKYIHISNILEWVLVREQKIELEYADKNI